MIPGYPKTMKHPAFQKGMPQQVWGRNYRPQPGETPFPGTSDRFPDVTVNDPNQQEWYESRGYVPADGTPSLIGEGNHEFNEYPKWIKDHDGEEHLVNSVEEESEIMGHNPLPKETKQVRLKKDGTPWGKRKPKSDKMRITD